MQDAGDGGALNAIGVEKSGERGGESDAEEDEGRDEHEGSLWENEAGGERGKSFS